jgi:hypothetical protein
MVRVLLSISLAPIAGGQLAAATGLLALSAGAEWLLTAYAIVSLALSVILMFWVSHGHRRIEHYLSRELADSVAASTRLQQENDELTASNEELRQTIAEQSPRQQEVVASVTGAINT